MSISYLVSSYDRLGVSICAICASSSLRDLTSEIHRHYAGYFSVVHTSMSRALFVQQSDRIARHLLLSSDMRQALVFAF